MRRENLVPVEWPAGLSVEIKGDDSLSSLFSEVPIRIQDFLRRAIDERYLPSGVQIMLAAEVTPMAAELKFTASGIIAKGQDDLKLLMARVSKWNQRNRRSFFQRVTSEYTGKPGAVAVFRRGVPKPVNSPIFHVAQYCFEERKILAGPRTDVGSAGYVALDLDTVPVNGERGKGPRPVHLELKEIDRSVDGFRALAESIEQDHEYLSQISALIPYSNLVLADPRTFHGGPEFQRRLGGLGLNILLHPKITIDQDLLTRVFLLADRLNTLFHFSAALHLHGELTGTNKAFDLITHSLGNALTQFPTMDDRLRAVLTVEEWNMEAAKLLSSRGDLTQQQLIDAGDLLGGKLEEIISRALDRPDESFPMTAHCLESMHVDPRFLAVLVELARNQRKISKSKRGRLDVEILKEGWVRLEVVTDCDYRAPRRLKAAFEAKSSKARGFFILLELCDLICAETSKISFSIGSEPFEVVRELKLPISKAHVSLLLGQHVDETNDAGIIFASRTVIDGINVSGRKRS